MTSTVLIEDEFGQVYTFHESRFNLHFPIRKIGIPGNSTLTFSNGPIGSTSLTDKIENESGDILSLTYEELLDRIRLSNIRSIEVETHDTPKKWFETALLIDPDYMGWKDWLVIVGIILILICIFVISIR
jgi:hypothetical protein